MNKKVTISSRWYGPVPTRNGMPLPKSQWARKGRKRKWIVRWYAPDGTRPQHTFDAKSEADDFSQAKTAEFESKGAAARLRRKVVTIAEFASELVAMRVGPSGKRLSIRTVREYKHVWASFGEFVGASRQLDTITMGDATRYVASLRTTTSRRGKPLSVSSVNKHKRNLKSACNVAVDLGYLTVNPFARLRQDKVADTAVRIVSRVEFEALVDASETWCREKGLWWESFVTVCYTAGIRVNEATHLMWADVNFEDDTIRVIAKPELCGIAAWQPKDHDSRVIPVPTITMDVLSRLHAEAPSGSAFVFLSPERVEWIRAQREAGTWAEDRDVMNNLDRDFKRLAKAAGVDGVRLHDLRRSAITHWARKLAVPIVRELAGHADIKTTLQYYVSIRPADLAEAREVTANALLADAKETQSMSYKTFNADSCIMAKAVSAGVTSA